MIICKKQTTDLQQGIQNLIDTMVEDYARWAKSLNWEDSKSTEFADKITTTEGNKYIKIISNNSSTAFIVKKDDKRFRKGDILMSASWNAPARNSARGNVLEGNFPMNWTGPLYLK